MKCTFQMPARQKPFRSLDEEEYRDWSEGEEEGPDQVKHVSTNCLAAADSIHMSLQHTVLHAYCRGTMVCIYIGNEFMNGIIADN